MEMHPSVVLFNLTATQINCAMPVWRVIKSLLACHQVEIAVCELCCSLALKFFVPYLISIAANTDNSLKIEASILLLISQ